MLLPEAIDASDALFDAHRIPGAVVIDQRSAELEVQPLRRRIGAEQKIGLPFAEPPLHLIPAHRSPCPVRFPNLAAAAGEAHHPSGIAPCGQVLAEKVHRIGELRENHHLGIALGAKRFDHLAQLGELRVGGQTFAHREQPLDVLPLFPAQSVAGQGHGLLLLRRIHLILIEVLFHTLQRSGRRIDQRRETGS
ncbi:MAG: hypothetical protein RML45_04380 [Acetobacteraceae bacterium]|nr:hypothetical protein [Acetobacteraceae bacterium]